MTDKVTVRTYLYIAVFLFSVLGQAKDFSYKATRWAEQPPIMELHLLADPMAQMGYQEIDTIRRGKLPYLGVDQIYVNATWEKSIFVKFGWKVSDRAVRDRMLKLGPGFSFHGEVSDGVDFVFFFSGMGRAEAATIVNRVVEEMEYKKKKTAWWNGLLINEAHAAGTCTKCLGDKSMIDQIEKMAAPVWHRQVRSTVSTCAVTAFNTVKDGATASIEKMKSSFAKYKQNPAMLWADTVKGFNAFKDMVMNMSDSFSKALGGLSGISVDMLKAVICPAIGGLISAGLGFFVGVGAVKFAAQLGRMVKALSDSGGLLKKVNKMKGLGGSQKASIARQVGMCASR